MKALKLVALGIVLFCAGASQAQLPARFTIGAQPQWAPVGYDDTRYYYLPDVESYYDVENSMFIYYEGNSWIHRSYLPNRYRNYDLYNGYKVGMRDYRGNTPYYNHSQFRTQYAHGRNRTVQRTIGSRPARDYYLGADRERNQVNRGRYNRINGNDGRGDRGYDRHGTERKQIIERGRYSRENNRPNGRGHEDDKGRERQRVTEYK